MQNEYENSEYADIIAGLKVQLAEKRKDLKEEDGNFPHIQEVIDAHWND